MKIFRTNLAICCLFTALLAFEAVGLEGVASSPLVQSGRLLLNKPAGRVDQVVPLLGGGFVVRDADFRNEEKQFLEIYNAKGQLVGKVGEFGRGPGQFFRLKDIAVSSDHTLWVADVVARVTRFDLQGKVKGTKLILKPGYHIGGMALDEARGFYYLTGCVPDRVYLDLGCTLVHQYSLKDGKYLKSFLKTPPEALEKHLLSLEDYLIDVDSRGRIYAVDAPLFKVFRIDPTTGKIDTFPLQSKVLKAAPPLTPGKGIAQSQRAYEEAFLIDRILVAGSRVVVSVRKPRFQGYLLHILDLDGKQLAADLPSPGQLVGKGRAGNLYFAVQRQRQFEISEYRLQMPGERSTAGR